ncbi:MAG: bifunctional pyr operon transcriptional regulator/uracil phosphoribosyltransferase PyrR [Verrucomicrobiales bacterium]|nr:bifunctional pyr operon transcriptional regulator/uracil phosphoribosyltransferase PyrR [Verrucomicrobiales bacterium]
MSSERILLDGEGIAEKVEALAAAIRLACGDEVPAFGGVYTRGVTLAKRVKAALKDEWSEIALGTLDVSLYRDDLDDLQSAPKLESSDIPFTLEGTRVVLFDEVIYTGRTTRAALDVLMDYGRPARVDLAVLVDRGGRELPLQPDFVGLKVETGERDYVAVRFAEDDGRDGGFLKSGLREDGN